MDKRDDLSESRGNGGGWKTEGGRFALFSFSDNVSMNDKNGGCDGIRNQGEEDSN